MAGQITKLEVQKKNKERVNVYIEGQYAFACTMSVALDLKKGQYLSQADIDAFKQQDDRHKAYDRAIFYLGFRARSRAEVERYLRGKGFSAEAIEAAVQRLFDEGYLGDEAFAQTWVDDRQRLKPKSRRALRYELKKKGLRQADIDAALEAVDEDDAAWRAIEPKLWQWRGLDEMSFKKKAGGFLSRRGFNYEIVRNTLERAWHEITEDR